MTGNLSRFVFIGVVLLVGSSVAFAESAAITTGTLFEEMVDMRSLATFPSPAYRTIQFSSYDRRSRLPGGPDWFANSDGFGREPIPNFEEVLRAPDANGVGEYLVADVTGPGAIVRLWTAAIGGRVRMFIDGADRGSGPVSLSLPRSGTKAITVQVVASASASAGDVGEAYLSAASTKSAAAMASISFSVTVKE